VSVALKPILVTGSHRSGTTWAGRVLAFSPTPLGYIWEPFNPRHRPGTFPVRFPRYFEYLCAENGAAYVGPMAETLAFRYRPGAELRSLRSPKDATRMARDWGRFARSRRARATALVKDPIALFSSEWLADTFDMRVVVMIRHPASFATSVRRRSWRHRFTDFLDQPLLMRDFLEPHEGEIRAASERRPDLLDEAILLWNVLYGSVARIQERRPDWIYVRQEDMARDPVGRFREVYSGLGLEWSEGAERRVLDTSGASNPADTDRIDSIRRNSAAHVTAWKAHITPAEIDRVRRGTEPLASRWYGEDEW
jgi:Sulfotransferase family